MQKEILEQIIHLPDLEVYIEYLQTTLMEEKKKRQKFYEEITETEKAEFINGEIIMHSPVKLEHNFIGNQLLKLLSIFSDKNDLGYVGYEKIMISLGRNDYEPDLCFFKKEKSDKFSSKQSHFPAPDFVVEILSESTVDRDRGIKFRDYEAHKIEEYWIIEAEEQIVEQYILRNEKYYLLAKSGTGIISSRAIEGFTIPIRAMFDKSENLKTISSWLS